MKFVVKLVSIDGRTTNFSSFRIEVYYRLKHKPDISDSGLLFISPPVSADGSCDIDIPPSRTDLEDTIEIRVFLPEGGTPEILKRSATTLNEGDIVKINIKPKELPTLLKNPLPYLGCNIKLQGHVTTETGRGIPGRSVAIWARPRDGSFQVVLTSITDKAGKFFGDFPTDMYEEAYYVIDIDGEIIKEFIHLENGKLPQKVLFPVLKKVENLKEGAECNCEMDIPRLPDAEDVANSPGTYTTDLGGGRCVDFTAPNRTFEEFTFSLVVRRTEPAIRGLTMDEPNTWQNRSTFHLVDSLLDIKDSLNTSDKAESEREKVQNIIKNISPRTMKAILRDPENLTTANLLNGAMRDVSNLIARDLGRSRTSIPARGELTAENPIDWDDEPTFYQATSIAIGHLIQYKQKWKADGYSMGNLLYSVPLGPCQKKQIAIVDWERRDIGRRDEMMGESERLTAMMSRDRAITDIVNGALTEGIHAKSEAGTWGVSGGASIFGALTFGLWSLGGGASVAGGTSGSESEAWQDSARRISTLALSTLSDNISQSASAFRTQHGTVVQTVEQQERVTAVTDVVSNNNHCHAITIEYFEILRHFLVTNECANVQECLFVPLLLSRFDFSKAIRWRTVLRGFLLDRSLDRGFDAMDRILAGYNGSDFPLGSYAEEPIISITGELHLTMDIFRPRDRWMEADDEYVFHQQSWDPLQDSDLLTGFVSEIGFRSIADAVWHLELPDKLAENQPAKDDTFENRIAPHIARRFVDKLQFVAITRNNDRIPLDIDATLHTHYRRHADLFITLRNDSDINRNIPRMEIASFRIEVPADVNLTEGSRIVLISAAVRYRTEHLEYPLFADTRLMDDLTGSKVTQISTPLTYEERRNPRGEDTEVARKLVSHLNENLEFYHKVIWFSMDRDRRFMLLDGFIAPNSNGRSVASVVENRLIGIVGNSLVMPVAPGLHLDPTYTIDKVDDLRHAYAATVPPLSIAIPTRGVYAESVIGKCNSCESIDDTKFWRFEESPCGVEPTAILPVSTETRRAEPGDLRPQQFPTPLVNLQNIPIAPESTGLEAALRLLSTPNIFENLTGLDQTQKNALAALLSSADVAKFLAKEAAGLARQSLLAKSGDKTMQKINDAEKTGGISSEEATKLRTQALRGMTGQDSTGESSLMKQPEIRRLLDSASERPNFAANFTTPSESFAINASDGGTSGSNITYQLIKHLGRWLALNLDPRTGKAEMHIDQNNLEEISSLFPEALTAIKFQIHSISFTTNKSFASLVNIFDHFEDLPDPDILECVKILPDPGIFEQEIIAVGDEYRWRVPINKWQLQIEKVTPFLIPFAPSRVALEAVLNRALFRRFDIRIVDKISRGMPQPVFEVTAQTLADHPYAGNRAWKLTKAQNSNEFTLETIEVNTFPWIVDYLVEMISNGEDARSNWEAFLGRYVEKAEGVIIDGSNIRGRTIYTDITNLLQNDTVNTIISGYRKLNEEFNRLKSRASPTTPI